MTATAAWPALWVLPALPWPALPDHLRVTLELLLALAWQHDRRATPPLSAGDLAAQRGLTPRTLRDHLRALCAAGLLQREAVARGRHIYRPEGLARAQEAAPEPVERPQRPAPAAECSGQPSAGERQAVVQRLSEAGVYPGLARELAGHPWVTLPLVEAWLERLRANRSVRHVGAVLVTMLRSPERCLPAPRCSPGPRCLPGSGDDPPQTGEPVRARRPAQSRAEARAQAALRERWQRALALLRERLGAQSVEVWLARSQPITCDSAALVVAVASPQAADWLSHRHHAALCAAASETWGRPLQVRLVVGRAHQLA